MKKNTSKAILTGLLLSLLLAVTVVFTGCGSSGPETLEEYISSNEEAQSMIDSLNTGGLSVKVEGDTIIYSYQYDQTFDSSVLDAMKTQIENTLDGSSSTFTTMADTLEEQSGIEKITVRVVYLNGDGTEIFSKEY